MIACNSAPRNAAFIYNPNFSNLTWLLITHQFTTLPCLLPHYRNTLTIPAETPRYSYYLDHYLQFCWRHRCGPITYCKLLFLTVTEHIHLKHLCRTTFTIKRTQSFILTTILLIYSRFGELPLLEYQCKYILEYLSVSQHQLTTHTLTDHKITHKHWPRLTIYKKPLTGTQQSGTFETQEPK